MESSNNKRKYSESFIDDKDGNSRAVARPSDRPAYLTRLPQEILILILDNILIKQEPLELHSKLRFVKNRPSSAGHSYTPLLNVLLSCQALYDAGIEVFYARNTLKFQHAVHLRKFISGLSAEQKGAITDIELYFQWTKSRSLTRARREILEFSWFAMHDSNYTSWWRDVIEMMPRLKKITIIGTHSFSGEVGPSQEQLEEFERRMKADLEPDKAGLVVFDYSLLDMRTSLD